MTPEQAGWAILTAAVIFGGELVVWFQGHLDRCRRRFVRALRRELRSRAGVRGGFGEDAGSASPAELPALAGGEARPPRPVDVALPPAPSALAGTGCPRPPAPAGPHRVRRVAL